MLKIFQDQTNVNLFSRSKSFVEAEWEQLQQPQVGRSAFQVAQNNRNKNRYPDVLPYDKNRVTLTNSRYINASKINILNKQFISCQAPLPSTFDDFWCMIYEQKVPLILMLTNFIENNKVKAHCYWPSSVGQSESFENLKVTLTSIEVNECMIKRYLSVAKHGEAEPLKVLHIQYTNWPDFGVPQSGQSLWEMVSEMDHSFQNSPSSPAVVHCSAGIGRTGTLLAIYSYLEHLKSNCATSITMIRDIVNDLRQQRWGMVQTIDQFDFIFKTVDELVHHHCK